MAQINTVIVLRNDSTTEWASSSYKLLPGEVGVGYMDRTVKTAEGNDETKKVPIVKIGDGNTVWADLPQAEGVFENDVILTSAFGKYTIPAAGYVNAGGAGMTTSEWLKSCLSEVSEPTITQPSITTTASIIGGGEMGAYITGVKWTGTYTDGSYQYGSVEKPAETKTGLTASNVTWAISNDIDTETATTEDGTFTFTSPYPQIDSESAKTYVTVTAKYTLDASGARTPLNNVGSATTGKIASITEQKTNTATARATGYRKPFWGVLTTPFTVADDKITITSDEVRDLPNGGTATKGLPSTLEVAEGSRQVIFCAKAGTYSSLTATDSKAQNATVTFTKYASAVNVEGANGYEAAAYDVFAVTWGDPIASAKSLNLAWA